MLAFPSPASADHGWHSRWVAQSSYLTMQPGQLAPFWISFRNAGTETWMRGVSGRQVNLALNGDDKEPFRAGMYCNWLWDDRIATTAEPTVRPGEIGRFNFCVRAPSAPGTYYLHLRPVVEGTAWLEDEGVFWVIVVTPSQQHLATVPTSGVAVHGVVTDRATGLPVSGVCVYLFASNVSNPFKPPKECWTETDERGRYVIDLTALAPVGARAGETWEIHFAPRSGRWTTSGRFTLSGVIEKNVELAGSGLQIYGRVTDYSTGLALADVCVRVGPTTAGTPFIPATGCYARTNAEGRYVIDLTERTSAGYSWYLTFEKAGYERSLSGMFTLSVSVERDVAMRRESVRSVQIQESGFGRGTFSSVAYAVRLRNQSAVESANVTLQIALYDASGAIIKATEDSVGRIDAGQEIGYASTAYLSSSQVPVRMTAQVIADRWTTSEPRPALSASAGTYVAGTYSASVTGTVSTSYASNLTYVRVSAIGYDRDGRIVGGGSAYVTVPAGGSAPVQVAYAGTTPTGAQLFAQVTCLTSFSWC